MSPLDHHLIDLTEGDFRLEREAGRYVLMGPGDQVVKRASRSLDIAIATLDRIGRESRRTTRACLCCSQPFASEGRHNRMCPTCRGRRSGLGKEWG